MHAPVAALLLVQLLPSAAPGSVEELQRVLTEAGAALERGDLGAAETGFRRAASMAPDQPLPALGLCELEARRERWEQALAHCREARRLAPQAPLPALQVARLLVQMGRADEALEAFSVARGLAPGEPEVWGLPARLLLERGRHAEAQALLERGLQQAPAPEIAEELGYGLLAEGKGDRAREVAAQGLERWPGSSGLKLILGLALAGEQGQVQRERAAALLGEAIEEGVADTGPVRLERGRVLLALGRHEEAAADLREAARLLPESQEAHFLLAQALRETGAVEEAGAATRRFWELRGGAPPDEGVLRALERARALALDGQLLAALEGVDAVLKDDPALPGALAFRAKLLGSLGREGEALDAARAAREGAPDVAEHHYLEGVFLVRSGALEEGTASLERALALDPGLGEAQRLLGEVAQARGRDEEAVERLRAAVDAGLADAALHRALAASLDRLGRADEARVERAEAQRLEQP